MSELPPEVPEPTQEDKDRGCICMYLFNGLHRQDCPLATAGSKPFPTADDYGMPGGDRVTFGNERAQAASIANRMMEPVMSPMIAGMRLSRTRTEELPDGEHKLQMFFDESNVMVEIRGKFTLERFNVSRTD